MVKDICLKIDYRDQSVDWWDWSETDKEGTAWSLFTGEKALYTFYKIKNTIFDIYKTLLMDLWAGGEILKNTEDNKVLYGNNFVILLEEKMILHRTLWDKHAYKVYRQNMKTGELELL